MSLESDLIVDRRRLRRKLSFWRVTAVMVAGLAIVAGGYLATRSSLPTAGSIARIKIEGVIQSNDDRIEALEQLGKSSAAAVIMQINSVGGTMAGSEQLYNALLRLKAKKPVVAVIEGVGASGAYMAAIASDHIVAQNSSAVGSIGVVVSFPNFSGALKTLGVEYEEMKSSPLKATPNGFAPTSAAARAATEASVMDSYAWFRSLVQTRRAMDDAQLDKVADGRVFTGRQALDLKLIDQLGDEKTAVAWLVAQNKIKGDLPVRDYKLSPKLGEFTFLRAAASVALDAAGLSAVARRVEQGGFGEAIDGLGLTGMLAISRSGALN